MGFELVTFLFASVLIAVVLASVPLFLKKLGFFDWLGKTKLGSNSSKFLGSDEPSKFALNMTRVFFFVLIAFYVTNGITSDATQFELHKPVISEMEACNTTFSAIQISPGNWAIKCNEPSFVNLNFSVNSSLGS